MAFFDWNHDGKKAMPQEEVNGRFDTLFLLLLIFIGMAAAGILIVNLIGIISGYGSWPGIVISVIALVLIIKALKKHRSK